MTVKAVLLRPGAATLEPMTLTRDRSSGTHLIALYGALGVRLVDVIRLTDSIDCWLDDEGRVNGSDRNPLATAMCRAFGWHLNHGDDIRGAVLFAAHDGSGGMASLSDRQRAIVADAFAQAQRM